MKVARFVVWSVACVAFLGCGEEARRIEAEQRAERALADAEDAWRRREPGAYDRWLAVDPRTRAGADARRRLRRAAPLYDEGATHLAEGAPGSREAIAQAVGIAPPDPWIYLRVARAFRRQGLTARAAEHYAKFLSARPTSPEAPKARRELQALDPAYESLFDPPASAARLPRPEGEGATSRSLGSVLLVVAVVALLVLGGLAARSLGRRSTLSHLAARHPELHPEIAYLVGTLRHELLKHRVGPIGAALALASGDSDDRSARTFLSRRLYDAGTEPLREAFDGYARIFERALGHGLRLRRDPSFRSARRALARIDRLRPRVIGGNRAALARLAEANESLQAFDRLLATLAEGLVRTTVDDALLAEVVDDVRREQPAASDALDELHARPIAEPVDLEIFRVDLVIVLRNLLRNAVLAASRGPTPRKASLGVDVRLEPTGEETVRIQVTDTSLERLDLATLRERPVDRGLGLVVFAVERYGGTIAVSDPAEGIEKAVTVSFFRV